MQLVIREEIRRARFYPEDLGNGLTLAMVRIPGGTFLMGSPEDEEDRSNDEGPQHRVTVPSFYLGKYPVTQAQWQAVAEMTQFKVEINLEPNPSHFTGADRPVEQVSWHEAVEFCARLEQRTGRPYRLPSEAEWEYACRAGTTTPFAFGETITPELANYNGNYTYGRGPKGTYREETTPVGSFPANGFGLYDMHGNVYEWCADHWHGDYENAPIDGTAWIKNGSNPYAARVLRGGSWLVNPGYCRSAFRDYDEAGIRYFNDGFRLCCSVPRTL